MSVYFSATTLWFYDGSDKEKYVAGIGWPSDAVEISDDELAEYTQPAPPGFLLGADEAGKAAWVAAPLPEPTEIIAAAEAKKSRLRKIADAEIAWRQDAVGTGIATPEESAALTEWKKYRVLVMRVDTSAADINWPAVPE